MSSRVNGHHDSGHDHFNRATELVNGQPMQKQMAGEPSVTTASESGDPRPDGSEAKGRGASHSVNKKADVVLDRPNENLFWRNRHLRKIFIFGEDTAKFHYVSPCAAVPGGTGKGPIPCGCCKPTLGVDDELCTFGLGDKYHTLRCHHVAAKGTKPVLRAPCLECTMGEARRLE